MEKSIDNKKKESRQDTLGLSTGQNAVHYHEKCRHPGTPCGEEGHRGSDHGYCYYCSLCN